MSTRQRHNLYHVRGRIFAAVLSAVVFSASFAGAHQEHPKTGDPLVIECGKTTTGVKIDGKLDEWKFTQPAVVDVKQQLFDVWQGDWKDADDCSGVVYMMYDDKYIYVAGEFKDEKLIAQQTGSNIWMNECLEIFFDSQDILMGGHNHYQFGFAPTGPGDKPQVWNWCNETLGKAQQACDNYVKLASDVSDPYTGYTLEASIEIAQLDALEDIIEEGTVIGYHIAIDDADDNAERDLQITWSSFEAHDQLHFGDLVFTGPLAVSPASALTAKWGQIKGQTP
jgi:hypothetical protein